MTCEKCSTAKKLTLKSLFIGNTKIPTLKAFAPAIVKYHLERVGVRPLKLCHTPSPGIESRKENKGGQIGKRCTALKGAHNLKKRWRLPNLGKRHETVKFLFNKIKKF